MFTFPNIITLANLLCGCAAVVVALAGGDVRAAFWLIAAAAVCDFADGLAARLTERFSTIGAELDSLADAVSFGVAPAAVLWTSWQGADSFWGLPDWLGWAVFAVTAFSALRLARFNVEDDHGGDFRGLPTPASALGIAAACAAWGMRREVILAVVVFVCFLLVSNLRMVSLKFSGWGFKANEERYALMMLAVLWALWMGVVEATAFIVYYYVGRSLLLGIFRKR